MAVRWYLNFHLRRRFPHISRAQPDYQRQAGVLVIEAALRSGSLVTVRCARSRKDVFALRPIGNPGSKARTG